MSSEDEAGVYGGATTAVSARERYGPADVPGLLTGLGAEGEATLELRRLDHADAHDAIRSHMGHALDGGERVTQLKNQMAFLVEGRKQLLINLALVEDEIAVVAATMKEAGI